MSIKERLPEDVLELLNKAAPQQVINFSHDMFKLGTDLGRKKSKLYGVTGDELVTLSKELLQ